MGLALLVLVGLVGAVIIIAAWTAWWITHPPRRTFATALARGRAGDPSSLPAPPSATREWSEETLMLAGARAPVWIVQGDAPRGPVIILSHGWGDSRIGALSRCQALLPFASRIIMWDMPGHGMASGVCSLGTREVAMLRELCSHAGSLAPNLPIVLMGWSLGAGVSIAAASDWDHADASRIGCVIAEAPYRLARTPAASVLRLHGLPTRVTLSLVLAGLDAWLRTRGALRAGVGFDRAKLAARMRAPLLVLHGEDDDVSPVEDGRAIAAAARQGTILTLAGAGHHGLWTTPAYCEACTRAVRELLERTHLVHGEGQVEARTMVDGPQPAR